MSDVGYRNSLNKINRKRFQIPVTQNPIPNFNSVVSHRPLLAILGNLIVHFVGPNIPVMHSKAKRNQIR